MIELDHLQIGDHRRPFIIAEMSGNHNQSLERALALVDAAAQAGADAIKLQTFTADTMTLDSANPEFTIQNKSSLWQGQSLHKLYQMAHTPWDWHAPIMQRAKAKGLVCFSSPFDATAVDFLETLDVPAYKIASFECIDLPLIRRVAQTGKPMIISTGMASVAEIAQLYRRRPLLFPLKKQWTRRRVQPFSWSAPRYSTRGLSMCPSTGSRIIVSAFNNVWTPSETSPRDGIHWT